LPLISPSPESFPGFPGQSASSGDRGKLGKMQRRNVLKRNEPSVFPGKNADHS